MASEIEKKPPKHKAWKIALGFIALLLAVFFGGLYWLVGTEGGTRSLLSMAVARSPVHIEMRGVHGRLADLLRIDSLEIEAKNQTIVLNDVRLDWRPWELRGGVLHVKSLHAAQLRLVNKIDQHPEPPHLPDNIAVPISLRIDSVQVDGGEIAWGPLALIKLGGFAFNLDFDGKRYRFGLQRFAASSQAQGNTVAGNLSGNATLAVQKPYALQAAIAAGAETQLAEKQLDVQGRFNLGGSLARLNADLDVNVLQARVQGKAVLQPFSDQAFVDAQLTASALDLFAADARLPHTALDIDLNADHSGAGSLNLRNKRAGPLDKGVAPLDRLHVDFSQHAQRISLDRIAAGYGDASITGKGGVANGAVDLALKVDKLNLHTIVQSMQATQLAGTIDLHRDGNRQTASLDLTQPLAGKTASISAHAELADQKLALDKAAIALGSGRVDFSGHYNLSGAQEFAAQGQASHFRLQDLGKFERFPQTDVSGGFTLHGMRQPKLIADLDFKIADSTVANQHLQGEGQAQLRADHLRVPRLLVTAGDNRLQAEGELSASGSGQLRFTLDAPHMDQFGAAFGGQMQANGTASGTLAQPHINANWKANKLRLPGEIQLDAMDGKADAEIGARADAPLNIAVRAAGLSTPKLNAREIRLDAHGSNAQHSIDAALVEENQNWTAGAVGGVKKVENGMQWHGELRSFVAAGRVDMHLAAPAPLTVGTQRVQLEQMRLQSGTASLVIERFTRDAHGIVTRGSIDRFQVAPYLKFASADPALATDLMLAGDWNITIADTVDGSVHLRRQSGDLVMKSETPIALGLQKLEASAVADRGRITLQFDAEGARLGRIAVNANATAGSGAQRFTLAPQAPLSGRAKIDVPSLAWAGALVSTTLQTDGRLQGDITLAGTAAQPRVDGRINGSELRVYIADSGINLQHGSLDASFQNDTLLLKNLSFQGGGGRIVASGPARFGGNPSAQIAVVAEHFAALDRSDRKLVVSGNAGLNWESGAAAIKGALSVDGGYFNLGRSDTPQLSNDVVVVGRNQKSGGGTPLSLDVDVAFGNGIALSGRGIEGVLRGRIHLSALPKETMQAQGELNVANGTYTAYGRKLQIERGALLFHGPLNNPSLDILAMRRGTDLEVEAGVAVRGTLLAPNVTLVSEPTVSDAEKLSWLVLGRGLSTVGAGDVSTLQSAAGALLSQGATSGVSSRLASAVGLDTLSVGTNTTTSQQGGTVQQRIVTLGKQVSSRLYVGYEQGLESASSVLHLRYTLSKRVTVEGEAGTRSALLLFFNFVFD